ncbi:hypothetical protein sscle_16g108350 [Sclerotinia sclerotiorum 1980 UF-70]|uniref:Uncharacterized protein n=1 Tax=Sclerotinia sclerotiorum (strain ATCC 18683 / 1980 / Ss-1) TaxID=665079 RepID=A0A1D9QM98_SCLS1|nr:hypothetical protein sscle_16g108350 [Sclerotinia sclerotiorum 1980 UF-70]
MTPQPQPQPPTSTSTSTPIPNVNLTPNSTPKPPTEIPNTTCTTTTTTTATTTTMPSRSSSPSSTFVSGSRSQPRSLPPNVVFAPSTLYIFLADIGHESLFHWGYLLTSPPPPPTSTPFLAPVTGTIFHITNPTGPWTYQSHTLPLSQLSKFIPTLLFILKLSPIDSILYPALSSRLAVLGLETQLECLELSISSDSDSSSSHSNSNSNSNPNPPSQSKTPDSHLLTSTTQDGKQTPPNISTQIWTLHTLRTLEEEGYISFPEHVLQTMSSKYVVECIESEAVAGAGWYRMRGAVGWERSAWVGE